MIKLILGFLFGNISIAMLAILILLASCDCAESGSYQEKFMKVLERHQEEKKTYTKHIMNLEHLPQTPSPIAIQAINNFINTLIEYKVDRVDNWQTPWSTINNGFGDCEDYVILKYSILKEYGIDPDDMRMILAVHKENFSHHAYLEVKLNRRSYYLDNNSSFINEPPKGFVKNFAISEDRYSVFVDHIELFSKV